MKEHFEVIVCMSLIFVLIGAFAVLVTYSPKPAWCTYPDDRGIAALESEVHSYVAGIHRNSPGQYTDTQTIRMALLSECAK